MAAALTSFKKDFKSETFNMKDEEMEVSEQLEEGEISEDENSDLVADVDTGFYESQVDDPKTEVARRFDLIGDLSLAVPKDELDGLYKSLCIDQDNERHYRFNTVHMRGTRNMKTKDIFEYFSGLEPTYIEWLDDGVCNVKWDDEILPARALLYLSIEIKNLDKRFKTETALSDYESDSDIELTTDTVDACKLKFYIPPGNWRKGVPCDKSKEILVRYASQDDKKVITVDRDRHEHRRKHRHSKYGKKSKHREIHVEEPARNPWGDLAMTWGRGEGVERIAWPSAPPKDIPDLRSSLNDTIESRFIDNFLLQAAEKHRAFPPSPVLSSSDEESLSESEEEVPRRRKLPRMYADAEEAKQRVKRIASHSGDLRDRLNLRKKVAVPHGSLRQQPVKYKLEIQENSDEDLSSDWAVEHYKDFKRTIASREREVTDDSESELELGDDEPGELLQIEIDNDRYEERKSRKKH